MPRTTRTYSALLRRSTKPHFKFSLSPKKCDTTGPFGPKFLEHHLVRHFVFSWMLSFAALSDPSTFASKVQEVPVRWTKRFVPFRCHRTPDTSCTDRCRGRQGSCETTEAQHSVLFSRFHPSQVLVLFVIVNVLCARFGIETCVILNVAISSQEEFATFPRILIQVLLPPASLTMSGSASWNGVKGVIDGTSGVTGSLGDRQKQTFQQVRALDTETQALCDFRGTGTRNTQECNLKDWLQYCSWSVCPQCGQKSSRSLTEAELRKPADALSHVTCTCHSCEEGHRSERIPHELEGLSQADVVMLRPLSNRSLLRLWLQLRVAAVSI